MADPVPAAAGTLEWPPRWPLKRRRRSRFRCRLRLFLIIPLCIGYSLAACPLAHGQAAGTTPYGAPENGSTSGVIGATDSGTTGSDENETRRRPVQVNLGIQFQRITTDRAKSLGVSQGLEVTRFWLHSPAAQAGVKLGDVILRVNNQPVTDQASYRRAFRGIRPNQSVTLDLLRAGKPASAAVTAGALLSAEPMLRIETGMHIAPILRIGTDRAERYLITASRDKTVRIWDLSSGRLQRTLRLPLTRGREGLLFAAAISPDGSTVACGGWTGVQWDGTGSVYLFDRATGRMLGRIKGMPSVIQNLTFSPDGRLLFVGLAGRQGVRLYRTLDHSLAGQDRAYGGDCIGASFSGNPDEHGAEHLVTSSRDGMLRLYEVADRANGGLHLLVSKPMPAGTTAQGLSFSPDGTKIAAAFADTGAVQVVSGADLTPQFLCDVSGIRGVFAAVAWSADGKWLYGGGIFNHNGTTMVRRWQAEAKGLLTDTPASGDTITQLLPRSRGGVYYAAVDPAWGVIDGAGQKILSQEATSADYRSGSRSFLVSNDGATVQFSYTRFNRSPTRFSFNTRLLTLVSPTTRSPLDPALHVPLLELAGHTIAGWQNGNRPTLDGARLRTSSRELCHALAVAADGQHFALGSELGVRYYDRQGKVLWYLAFPLPIWNLNISGDGRLVVCAGGDGIISWIRAADGIPVCEFFPHRDGKRWVVWTPSGYYDCSPGGEDLIGWHINSSPDAAAEFFSASRFRSTYYRPDVLPRILTTADEEEALKQANAASGRQARDNPVQDTLPPVVAIVSPSDGAPAAGTRVTVRYSVRTPSGEPVTGVKALVDGRPVEAARDLQLVSADGSQREIQVTVPEHDCIISVLAQNAHGFSEPATIHLKWVAPVQAQMAGFVIKPKLYVLSVGVSLYQDDTLRLVYPSKDAHDFAMAMAAQKGGLYGDAQVRVLTDAQATRDAILDGLQWIEQATTQHDVAMIFLSGHGANDPNGNYFYLPANFNRDRLKSTSIPFSDIKSTVENLHGKTLFFVDSCHSGNALGTARTRGLVDTTGVVNELASAENGAVVFAASTGSQTALEDAAWGNGAFTRALVEAISGKADYNHDGRITVNMIDLYISERVKELTGGRQTPTTTKPQTIPDFPVAVRR